MVFHIQSCHPEPHRGNAADVHSLTGILTILGTPTGNPITLSPTQVNLLQRSEKDIIVGMDATAALIPQKKCNTHKHKDYCNELFARTLTNDCQVKLTIAMYLFYKGWCSTSTTLSFI